MKDLVRAIDEEDLVKAIVEEAVKLSSIKFVVVRVFIARGRDALDIELSLPGWHVPDLNASFYKGRICVVSTLGAITARNLGTDKSCSCHPIIALSVPDSIEKFAKIIRLWFRPRSSRGGRPGSPGRARRRRPSPSRQ